MKTFSAAALAAPRRGPHAHQELIGATLATIGEDQPGRR